MLTKSVNDTFAAWDGVQGVVVSRSQNQKSESQRFSFPMRVSALMRSRSVASAACEAICSRVFAPSRPVRRACTSDAMALSSLAMSE
ncbi:MAG: hypothetical protein ACI3Z7_01450 [Candidatus Aphodosoma sp.]